MISTRDAIMIHMIDHGPVEGATLTVKGYVGGHIIKARCLLQEKETLSPLDIEAVIGWLQTAEETLNYLTDPEEEPDA